MICTFRNLIRVCLFLGLKPDIRKTCMIYKGYANGKYCRITIHKHSEGRDVPTGTLDSYLKELGVTNDQFKDYLNKI